MTDINLINMVANNIFKQNKKYMFWKQMKELYKRASSRVIQIKNESEDIIWNETKMRKCWKALF